ncbi:hypothetical protein H8J56_28005, partial [Klebsiella sp. Kps]|uniref:hypothetical protein n=1 Tax=Klebsiella sp. Kps TaxID=2758579 RepID=UPI00164926AE
IEEMLLGEIEDIVERNSDEKSREINDAAIVEGYRALIPNGNVDLEQLEGLDEEGIIQVLTDDSLRAYQEVEDRFGPE